MGDEVIETLTRLEKSIQRLIDRTGSLEREIDMLKDHVGPQWKVVTVVSIISTTLVATLLRFV